ncbi:MAG: hypothetical protein GXY53_11210 [Desulfobulbus sp.]|nr:hypothetical protein [Desulfobulbus sp.]
MVVLIVEFQLVLFRYAYTKDLELPSRQLEENRSVIFPTVDCRGGYADPGREFSLSLTGERPQFPDQVRHGVLLAQWITPC